MFHCKRIGINVIFPHDQIEVFSLVNKINDLQNYELRLIAYLIYVYFKFNNNQAFRIKLNVEVI